MRDLEGQLCDRLTEANTMLSRATGVPAAAHG
jgi:hypothetical protein